MTKRVFVMERCAGRTITEVADELLEKLATSRGTTVEGHRAAMREEALSAAAKAIHAASGGPCGRMALDCVLQAAEILQRARFGCLAAAHAAANLPANVLNASAGCLLAGCNPAPPVACVPLMAKPIALQLGPDLIDRLFEVHAHSLWEEGVFNAECAHVDASSTLGGRGPR